MALAFAAAPTLGCGPATYNVPAARAFANEDADLGVVADRAADLTAVPPVVETLLLATPYTPGDRWTAMLRLDDDGADKLRERFESKPPYDGDHEVPLAKLYRVQLEQALAQAKNDRAGKPAKYPSVLDALATLDPAARDLPARFRALVEAQRQVVDQQRRVRWFEGISMQRRLAAREANDLRDAQSKLGAAQQQAASAQQDLDKIAAALSAVADERDESGTVAKDGLEGVAFALRLEIEALAVAPYLVRQAKRVQRSEGRGREHVAPVEDARDLMDVERAFLGKLADALVRPAGRALVDTGGFAMHENPIAQAARVNFDSTHIHIKGDSRLLIYNQLKNTDSHAGRTRRLAYSVDPVFMVGGKIIAAYDFLHVKNAASVNAGFTTNRLFGGGGDLENKGSLGTLLGLDGLASDFFDIGMDLMGVHTNVVLARFTSGEVSEVAVDAKTGADLFVVERAPFQLSYQQIDVGFDFTILAPELAEDLYVEGFLVGFKYLNYQLPRILYETRERTPEEGKGYVLSRQTPPQSVSTQMYMGGLALRMGQGDWPRVSFFGELGVYGGVGPADWYYTQSPEARGGTRTPAHATMLGFDAEAALGVRFRLTKQRRPRVVTELSYGGEIVGEGAITQINETRRGSKTSYTVGKSVDVGGFDLFHGPRLILVLVL